MTISMSDLEKLLEEFPDIEAKSNSTSWDYPEIPSESDNSYITKNQRSLLWLLDNSNLILQALANYYEGERPSNE